MTSSPRAGTDTYGAGERIEFTVTFSNAVDVSDSRPHLEFALGNSGDTEVKEAAYRRGAGTTFTPAAGATGAPYATYMFTVNDGTADSASAYTMTVDVTAGNNGPTASDNTVTTAEDTAYTFAATDFNFADTDGDTLASVKVTALESAGDLELDGTDVTLDQVIAKADIDAGDLTFTPAAGATGAPYATFTFTVNDGADDSASAYTMTIDVTAGSTPPISVDALVSNIGQANSDTGNLGSVDQAQAFTTGGNANGYTLTSVEVQFGSVASAATYGVGIWSSDEEVDGALDTDTVHEPYASLGALTCPALTPGSGDVVYECTTTGINLDAGTTYLFVVDSSGTATNRLRNTASDSEDAGSAPGWSIGNISIFRTRNLTGRTWVTYSRSKKIRIHGAARSGSNNAPTASDNTVTTVEDTAYTFAATDFGFMPTRTATRLRA